MENAAKSVFSLESRRGFREPSVASTMCAGAGRGLLRAARKHQASWQGKVLPGSAEQLLWVGEQCSGLLPVLLAEVFCTLCIQPFLPFTSGGGGPGGI